MSNNTVEYHPVIPDGGPGIDCPHASAHQIHMGVRIVDRGTTSDGHICLKCGEVTPVSAEWEDWWDGWLAAWLEHGWNSGIGQRLQQMRLSAEPEYG